MEVKLGDLTHWWDGTKELIDKHSNLTTVIHDRVTKRAEEHGDLKNDTKDYLSCIVKPDVAKLEIHQKNDLEAISKELDAVKQTIEEQKAKLTAQFQTPFEGLQQLV